MPDIANLPLVIVDSIIRKSAKRYSRTHRNSLKCLFPLLAVCRAWREVGVPFVYDTAFFYYVSQNVTFLKRENFSLAKENCLIHYVKNIKLGIDVFNLPSTTFNHLEEILDIKHGSWPNARHLSLSVTNDNTSMNSNISEERMHAINKELDAFTKTIAHTLPNIKSIKLSSLNSLHSINPEVVSNLLHAYRSRLQALAFIDCKIPQLDIPMGTLTTLEITRCFNYRMLLSRINCNILESLIFYSLDESFMWDAFITNTPNEIYFDRLHTLKIESYKQFRLGNHQDVDDSLVYNIYLPRLKILEIVACPPRFIEKTRFIFPKHIGHIIITDTPVAMKLIAESTIETITRIDVRLTHFSKNVPVNEFYNWSNILFGNRFQAKYGKAAIGSPSIPLSIETARWTNLTYLRWHEVEIFTLIKIITKLTRLKTIDIEKCIFVHIPPNIKDYVCPQKHSKSQLTKLNSNVTKVTFYRISNLGCNQNETFMCLQLVTLLLSSLQKMTIIHSTNYSWDSFIDTFKQWYPHLKKIEIYEQYHFRNN